jgi:transposase
MPTTPLLDLPQPEQVQMLAALRRARYGSLLALHILLLCAAGRPPTAIAAVLFCSRSSVYRTVRLYRAGQLGFPVDADGQLAAPVRTTGLLPVVQRSLPALLQAPPRASGWCRTRWSGATVATQLTAQHGLAVSAWTGRRGLHELGWGWKRAKLVAKDDDPQRAERLARIRFHREQVQAHEVRVFAAELAIHLLPQVGAAWMPQGTQEEIMPPGKNAPHSLAGALNLAPGAILHGLGPRKTHALFRALLPSLDRPYPAPQVTRISVVVDHYGIHKAQAVQQWLEAPSRLTVLWLPTYCPRANPLERAFGDVHDTCTRTHKRKRLRDVVREVEQPLRQNGPGVDKLSHVYDTPEVTAAVTRITAEHQEKLAA